MSLLMTGPYTAFGIAATAQVSNPSEDDYETINLRIPWPSGVVVDRVEDALGHIYRFGLIQYSAVQLRPAWQGVQLINNVLSAPQCMEIIRLAEVYANRYGWSKGRHVDYNIRPTRDIPVEKIGNKSELRDLYQSLEDRVLTYVTTQYNITAGSLRISDLFLTRYDANRPENFLAGHKDKSAWSFVIPLNDEFTGGGTYFFDTQEMWRPPVGSGLVFNGNQLHGGSQIKRGRRYILAGFLDLIDRSDEMFLKYYEPVYDGYAFQAGFRSGDLIIAIETCKNADEEGPTGISENEGRLLPHSGSTATTTFSAAAAGDDMDVSVGVIRSMVEVTTATTDSDWISLAQSCERLEPGADTVMIVRRGRSQSRASQDTSSHSERDL